MTGLLVLSRHETGEEVCVGPFRWEFDSRLSFHKKKHGLILYIEQSKCGRSRPNRSDI